MKSSLIKFGGVILIGLITYSNTEACGEKWKCLGSTDEFSAYYDTESITHPSSNIVRLSTKNDYTKKGVIRFVNRVGKKYENLSCIIEVMEINCVEKKFRLLSVRAYDNKGAVINSGSPHLRWEVITPESKGKFLYEEVWSRTSGTFVQNVLDVLGDSRYQVQR